MALGKTRTQVHFRPNTFDLVLKWLIYGLSCVDWLSFIDCRALIRAWAKAQIGLKGPFVAVSESDFLADAGTMHIHIHPLDEIRLDSASLDMNRPKEGLLNSENPKADSKFENSIDRLKN